MPGTKVEFARCCRILITFVSSLGPFVFGCDECESGETRCDGDNLSYCNTDEEGLFGRNVWRVEPCPVTCRYLGGYALCVGTREPVAECLNATRDICFDGLPSTCREGYAVPLSSCESGTHCVASATCEATCAISALPDPRCSARSFCDGNSIATCSCDFVTGHQDCGATKQCQEVDGGALCGAL